MNQVTQEMKKPRRTRNLVTAELQWALATLRETCQYAILQRCRCQIGVAGDQRLVSWHI